MKKDLFVSIIIFSFILLKITNWGVRLSDTNIYFSIASRVFDGQLPYKDFFFANFPFFIYVSSLYYFLLGKSLNLFYLTSVIEIAIVTFLIYKITYRKTNDYLISLLSSALYIFSFIILTTSDHQTGVSTASLLSVLGFYFIQKNKFFLSGLFAALCVLTKAYFLPVALSFVFYLSVKRDWKNLKPFLLGSLLMGFFVLLPFLIQSPKQLITDVFGFSLSRPAGLVKADIIWFFITKDFLLFLILLFNLFNFRKNLFFSFISLFAILFFFYYHDVYYLYLNFLIPFLGLSFYQIHSFIKTQFNPQKFVVPSIIFIFLALNLFIYITQYRNLQKVENFDQIITIIKKEKPAYLYGINDLTPALISLTKIPALGGVNDAHVDFFTKFKVYDKTVLTNKAIAEKTIVVAHGATYPELNIKEDILDNNIFDKETIYKNCKLILSSPVQAEGATNRINLLKCY